MDDTHRIGVMPGIVNDDVRSDLFHRRHEIDDGVLVQLNERKSHERLANRADAKVRVGIDRRLMLTIGIAESPDPFDSFHGDEGDALHPGQRSRSARGSPRF